MQSILRDFQDTQLKIMYISNLDFSENLIQKQIESKKWPIENKRFQFFIMNAITSENWVKEFSKAKKN